MTAAILSYITDYINICCNILYVTYTADALLRIFKVFWEYVYYQKHYLPESRLVTIFKRGFTYNAHTKYFALSIIIAPLIVPWISMPPKTYFAFMPLYWVWSISKAGHSWLEYAYWIREPHGLDYGAGLASNYFNGYLKLVLPSYMNDLGIRERIQKYENAHNVKFAINRLVILISNSMFIEGKLVSRHLEEAAPLEVVYKKRAGVNRPFRNAVYKLKIHNRFYYVAVEGATPLLSFFDSLNFPRTSTLQMQEMQREVLLKFYMHLKKLLSEWPETRDEAELLFYNANTPDGDRQDVGEVLKTHLQSIMRQQEDNEE